MLARLSILVTAAAATATILLCGQHAQASAIPHGQLQPIMYDKLQSRNLIGSLLVKRQSNNDIDWQIDAIQEDRIPPSCREQCRSYVQENNRCVQLTQGPQAVSNEESKACGCDAAYYDAAMSCAKCTPETFEAGEKENVKTQFAISLAFCQCDGYQVQGVDISSLPGSSVDNKAVESVQDSCKGDASTSAQPGSTQGTGAASAIQAQRVMALLVAALASSIIL